MQKLNIGKLAAKAGVGIDTVRFYERNGLLPKPDRTASGYRLYGPDEAARLQFIRRAKTLGFTLEEIRELLALNDGSGRRSSVRGITERRLADIEEKLAELQRLRKTLRHLLHECHGDGSLKGCPIIEIMTDKNAVAECHLPKTRATPRRTRN